MLSSNVKALISEVVELYSTTPLTQSLIDDGVNKLIKAKELLTNGKEEKPQEYKVWLFNGVLDDNYIENSFVNCKNGKIGENTYNRCSDYVEIPADIKELHIILPVCGSVGYHVGAFYDENKTYLYGVSRTDIGVKYALNDKEDLAISLEGNEKYFIVGSESNKSLCSAYYITTDKTKVEKTFTHESNEVYTIDTIQSINSIDVKTGDTVITKGYYAIGDGGEAVYDIVSYEEFNHLLPEDIQLQQTSQSLIETPVDEYGNHTLNNGLVAKLRLTEETTPEQWGAKGDGISNDCQAFTHMFAQIKTGKIVFKENATYSLGLIYEGDTTTSFKDNPYRAYMTGGLLGGQIYGKPIMANIQDVEFVGNNAKIELLNDQFGNSGMGLLNFAGRIDGLKIHDLSFDGKGRKLYYTTGNKNTNHTLFYAPSTFTSNSTLLKSIHPLYLKKEDKFDSGYFKNVEINNCYFYDAGAMYRKAGDWGGDFILVINPTAMDNVNIHHNRFEAWGRWVFAIDLGGNGECLTNCKFEDNTCIGNNAKDENDNFLIETPVGGIPNNGESQWRGRALGLIDFESKKCFDNVSVQRNYIHGAAGWAINGASRITQNVIIKDNYWYHCGGGYPYTLEFYSGEAKNWIIDNNEFVTKPGIKLGLNTNNIKITNNKNIAVRFLGLQGNIDIENNETDYGFNIDSMNAPTYLTEEERNVNLIFKNNSASINGNLNFPFMHYDFSGNTINGINLIDFTTHSDIGPSNQIVNTIPNYLQHFHAFGFRFTTPMEKPSIGSYWKSGDIIHESTKNFGLVNSGFYKNLIDGFSKYNWNFTNYINQKGLKDIKMLCTEDGIVPGVGAWGFNNQFTGWNDAAGKKFQDKSYVYTEDNLYYIEKAGTLDINNKPTHTDGISICGECELQWIDKIAKVELIEVV